MLSSGRPRLVQNYRSYNKIRQQEQIRPKFFSIYNFQEQGAIPLPNQSFIKKTFMQHALWMGKKHITSSGKWSWILANRFERMNTYLKGKDYPNRNKSFILITRINSEAKKHGTSYKFMKKVLESEGIGLDLEMIHILAIYEPQSFQKLCELVKRVEIDQAWQRVEDRLENPDKHFKWDQVVFMNEGSYSKNDGGSDRKLDH